MRLDKFLKVSRIFKRRTVASEMCAKDRIDVNGRVAKASTQLKVGDKITIHYSQADVNIIVKDLRDYATKDEVSDLYEIVSA